MAGFVSGRELCRAFHEQHVAPLLASTFADLPYAAALLGRGSEVLGHDDALSRDHNFEARVQVLLREDDGPRADAVVAALEEARPERFDGQPTEVTVSTVRAFVRDVLAVDLGPDLTSALSVHDWLSLPEQQLVLLTSGEVFHDDIGLSQVRERLSYYPRDVWLYLMAAGWWRLHPEVNLVGRIGHAGDELGSAVLGARLVEAAMRLCFLIERTYAPYTKWFGTAFAALPCGPGLVPLLTRVVRSQSWRDREAALAEVYSRLAAMHDALGVTGPIALTDVRMWERPFGVPWGEFPAALLDQVSDPAVRELAASWPFGGVEQVRELLWTPAARPAVLRLLG